MKVKRQHDSHPIKKLLAGELRLNPEGYGFFISKDRTVPDVFVPARHINHAMNGDEIMVEAQKNKRDGRFEGSVVKILRRAQSTVIGRIERHGDEYYLRTFDRASQFELHIPEKNLHGAQRGHYAVAKILQYPAAGVLPVGEVSQVIGDEVNLPNLTQAVLLKFNIGEDFPHNVKEEIKTVPQQVDKTDLNHGRVDLTDLPFITIDGITAKDFDDAVCVRKRGKDYVLYVSIADVSAYVEKGSTLDQEAYQRGTSVYLPHLCIPMLPSVLSNGVCSLNPHEWRKTITAEIHYDGKFHLTRVIFYRSLIRSQKRATYEEVEAFFDRTGDEIWPEAVRKSLGFMKELATQLIKQATARGSLGFDLPEAKVIFDAQGHVQNIVRSQSLFSHKLIEVFMVAANEAVASFFSLNGVPGMYRVHDEPDPMKMQNFVQLVKALGLWQKTNSPLSDFFKHIKGHSHETFLHSVF